MSSRMGENEAREVKAALEWAIGFEALAALKQPGTFEVIFNDDGSLWIETAGEGKRRGNDRISRARLDIITALCAHSEGVPVLSKVDAVLPLTGARVHSSRTASGGWSINIRKHSDKVVPLQEWVDEGRLSRNEARLLLAAVRSGAPIVLAGMPGSGKTTLLNSLGNEIDPAERVISVEDTRELNLPRLPDWQAFVEREGETTIRSLIKDAMRQRPDRILIGEARDGGTLQEALKSAQTGVKGFILSLHSGSAKETMLRMERMLHEAGTPSPMELIRDVVKVVVFLKGKRVREVMRVKR